jgi:hypothetical protein
MQESGKQAKLFDKVLNMDNSSSVVGNQSQQVSSYANAAPAYINSNSRLKSAIERCVNNVNKRYDGMIGDGGSGGGSGSGGESAAVNDSDVLPMLDIKSDLEDVIDDDDYMQE